MNHKKFLPVSLFVAVFGVFLIASATPVFANINFTSNETYFGVDGPTLDADNDVIYNKTQNISFSVTIFESLNISTAGSGNVTNVTFRLGRPDNTFTNYSINFTGATGNETTEIAVLNTSTSSPNNTFYINFTQDQFGAAGLYNFTWIAANATGTYNSTVTSTFNMTKETLAKFLDVRINDTILNGTVQYPMNATNANVSGSFNGTGGADDITFILFRCSGGTCISNTSTSVNATRQNNTAADLGAGSVEYVYGTSTATAENYTTGNSSARNMSTTKAPLANFLHVLINDTSVNGTLVYPGSVTSGNVSGKFNITGTLSSFNGAGDISFILFRVNRTTGQSVNDTVSNNSAADLAPGVFDYIYGTNATIAANFTPGNATARNYTIHIGVLTSHIDVSFNGAKVNNSFLYDAPAANGNVSGSFNGSTVSGTTGAADISLILFRCEGTCAASSTNATVQNNSAPDLGVNVYEYIYGTNATGSANYTIGNATARNLTINKTSVILEIFLNGTNANKAYEKGDDTVNITVTANSSTSHLQNYMIIETNFTVASNASTSGNSSSINVLYNNTDLQAFTLGNFTITANMSASTNFTSVTNTTGLALILRDTKGPVIQGFSISPSVDVVNTNIVVTTASISDKDSSSSTVKVTNPAGTAASSTYSSNTFTFTATSTPGTYTVELTSSDDSGNTNTASGTVELRESAGASSSSGGGGGGSSGSTTTTVAKETQTVNIVAGGTVTATLGKKETHGVESVTIEVENAVSNVKVSVENFASKPASVTQDVSGTVYRYLDISATGTTDDNVKEGKIKFEVEQSWINDNSVDINTVALNRFSDDVWAKLETRFLGTSGDKVMFEATTPGFSVFAVTAEEPAVETPVEETPEESAPLIPGLPDVEIPDIQVPEIGQLDDTTLAGIGIVVIIIVGAGVYFMKNKGSGNSRKRRNF